MSPCIQKLTLDICFKYILKCVVYLWYFLLFVHCNYLDVFWVGFLLSVLKCLTSWSLSLGKFLKPILKESMFLVKREWFFMNSKGMKSEVYLWRSFTCSDYIAEKRSRKFVQIWCFWPLYLCPVLDVKLVLWSYTCIYTYTGVCVYI